MSWQSSRKKRRKYRSKGEMKVILETAKIKKRYCLKKAMGMEGKLEKSEQNEWEYN